MFYFFVELQTSDLAAVFRGVKFSCHFTLHEIETRWKALMYNAVISKLALQVQKKMFIHVICNPSPRNNSQIT